MIDLAIHQHRRGFRRLLHNERGAALVEFTILLPVLLALFVLLTEGGRVMWYHQQVTKSVSSATRYLSRVLRPGDLCPAGGGENAVGQTHLTAAQRLALRGSLDPARPYLNPYWIDGNSLQASVTCIDNSAGTYRGPSRLPLIQVTVTTGFDFPLARVLSLVGGTPSTRLAFTVSDQTRLYGE